MVSWFSQLAVPIRQYLAAFGALHNQSLGNMCFTLRPLHGLDAMWDRVAFDGFWLVTCAYSPRNLVQNADFQLVPYRMIFNFESCYGSIRLALD